MEVRFDSGPVVRFSDGVTIDGLFIDGKTFGDIVDMWVAGQRSFLAHIDRWHVMTVDTAGETVSFATSEESSATVPKEAFERIASMWFLFKNVQ